MYVKVLRAAFRSDSVPVTVMRFELLEPLVNVNPLVVPSDMVPKVKAILTESEVPEAPGSVTLTALVPVKASD